MFDQQDAQQFIRALDENPADFDLRGIFADWLEEAGDDDMAPLVIAQRWMIESGVAPGINKLPGRDSKDYYFSWENSAGGVFAKVHPGQPYLPEPLFNELVDFIKQSQGMLYYARYRVYSRNRTILEVFLGQALRIHLEYQKLNQLLQKGVVLRSKPKS